MAAGNSIGSSIPKTHQVPDETKRAARLTVCGNATDREDAALLMKILGIHPSQASDEIEVEGEYIPHTPPRVTRSEWR